MVMVLLYLEYLTIALMWKVQLIRTLGMKPKTVWDTEDCCLNKYNKADEWTDKYSYGFRVWSGSIICIVLDFNKLSLSYTINGTDYGVAFKIKKSKYRLAVSSRHKKDSIELLEYSQN